MTTHDSLHPELVGLVAALHAGPPISQIPVTVLRQLMREQWFDAEAPAEIETRNISIPVDGRTIPARPGTSDACGP
jgi:hypothetical protein